MYDTANHLPLESGTQDILVTLSALTPSYTEHGRLSERPFWSSENPFTCQRRRCALALRSPASTRTSLTSIRLCRLCRSPRSFPCFHLPCHPAASICSRSLSYWPDRCRLHQMVPRLGANEPFRFLRRGDHSTFRRSSHRTAFMGATDE